MTAPEDVLSLHLRALGLPEPTREFRFCERRWRFDWAWPDYLIAFEFEGGLYSGGQRGWHQSVERYTTDCIKYSTAAVLGWIVVRAVAAMIRDGTAAKLIEQAFEARAKRVLEATS